MKIGEEGSLELSKESETSTQNVEAKNYVAPFKIFGIC